MRQLPGLTLCVITLTLQLLLTSPAYAQQPASFGRLFTTPAERILLDRMRRQENSPETVATAAAENAGIELDDEQVEEPDNRPPPELQILLSGTVQRQDGSYVLWINGEAINSIDLPEGMSVVQQGHLAGLRISDGMSDRVLLPGQRYHAASGTVTDTLLSSVPDSLPISDQAADNSQADAAANADNSGTSQPDMAGAIRVLTTLRDVMRYL